jgi:hypothetical protein
VLTALLQIIGANDVELCVSFISVKQSLCYSILDSFPKVQHVRLVLYTSKIVYTTPTLSKSTLHVSVRAQIMLPFPNQTATRLNALSYHLFQRLLRAVFLFSFLIPSKVLRRVTTLKNGQLCWMKSRRS